jgi:hypothetical protein
VTDDVIHFQLSVCATCAGYEKSTPIDCYTLSMLLRIANFTWSDGRTRVTSLLSKTSRIVGPAWASVMWIRSAAVSIHQQIANTNRRARFLGLILKVPA